MSEKDRGMKSARSRKTNPWHLCEDFIYTHLDPFHERRHKWHLKEPHPWADTQLPVTAVSLPGRRAASFMTIKTCLNQWEGRKCWLRNLFLTRNWFAGADFARVTAPSGRFMSERRNSTGSSPECPSWCPFCFSPCLTPQFWWCE